MIIQGGINACKIPSYDFRVCSTQYQFFNALFSLHCLFSHVYEQSLDNLCDFLRCHVHTWNTGKRKDIDVVYLATLQG